MRRWQEKAVDDAVFTWWHNSNDVHVLMASIKRLRLLLLKKFLERFLNWFELTFSRGFMMRFNHERNWEGKQHWNVSRKTYTNCLYVKLLLIIHSLHWLQLKYIMCKSDSGWKYYTAPENYIIVKWGQWYREWMHLYVERPYPGILLSLHITERTSGELENKKPNQTLLLHRFIRAVQTIRINTCKCQLHRCLISRHWRSKASNQIRFYIQTTG